MEPESHWFCYFGTWALETNGQKQECNLENNKKYFQNSLMDCSKKQGIYWKYKQDLQNEDMLPISNPFPLTLM